MVYFNHLANINQSLISFKHIIGEFIFYLIGVNFFKLCLVNYYNFTYFFQTEFTQIYSHVSLNYFDKKEIRWELTEYKGRTLKPI